MQWGLKIDIRAEYAQVRNIVWQTANKWSAPDSIKDSRQHWKDVSTHFLHAKTGKFEQFFLYLEWILNQVTPFKARYSGSSRVIWLGRWEGAF